MRKTLFIFFLILSINTFALANSQLPNTPNEDAIKTLLLESLEAHYGSLTAAVVKDTDISRIVNDLKAIVERYQQ